MTKVEYLDSLKDALQKAAVQDIEGRVEFYEEMIDDKIEDGMSEEDAVSSMEEISSIVSSFLLEKPVSELVKQKVKRSRDKADEKGYGLLWIILAILGFPVWLPLLITFFVFLITFYIVFVAIVVSLFACYLAIGFSGLACLFAPFLVFRSITLPAFFAAIGIALVFIGLTILLWKPFMSLFKLLKTSFSKCIKGIKSIFIR